MTNAIIVLLQRQVTTVVPTVALAFLVTWVISNQIIAILLIRFPDASEGAAVKLRPTMSLGAFEEQSVLTVNSLTVITA